MNTSKKFGFKNLMSFMIISFCFLFLNNYVNAKHFITFEKSRKNKIFYFFVKNFIKTLII